MIIRFLRSNNPAAFVILPVIALAIWAFGFVHPHVPELRHAMPFYELLVRPLLRIPWLSIIVSMLLVIAEGLLLNYIVNENEVLIKKTALPALFYIVFMSNNSAMLELHPVVFANLFLLFALSKILNSYRKDIAFSQVFDAGLLISVASLFYFPCVVFFPAIGIALVIFRPFLWREWLISFLGLIIPYLFVVSWYFWYNELDYLFLDKIFVPLMFKKPSADYPQSFYFLLTMGWIIILLSFGKLFNGLSGGSQKTKKAIILMLWLFLFSIVSVFLAPALATKYFSLLCIPAAVICSNYFIRMRRELWGEILFLLFLVALFVNLVVNIF